MRGTSNSNQRGSAEQRRRRKQWLLDTFGDGELCLCWLCEVPLDFETVTVDRIIPGCEGGTYERGNIRPACSPCNTITGSELGVIRRQARRVLLSYSGPEGER